MWKFTISIRSLQFVYWKKSVREREIRLYTKSPYTHQWIPMLILCGVLFSFNIENADRRLSSFETTNRRSVIIVSNENAMGAWSKKSKKWFIFHKSTIFLHCCSQPLITRLQFKILIASEINQRKLLSGYYTFSCTITCIHTNKMLLAKVIINTN